MHCDVSAERYQYRRRSGCRKEGKGAGGVRRREGEEMVASVLVYPGVRRRAQAGQRGKGGGDCIMQRLQSAVTTTGGDHTGWTGCCCDEV